MQLFQQSEATAAQRRLFFHAVDATDGITAETGLTGAGRLSKNGAATAASASITEIDSTNMPGRYYVELTAAELDTLGIIEFRFKAAACAEVVARGQVVPFDPYDATRMGLTALPNANAEAAGGLYTRGAGAGQINQPANGRVDVNIVALAANVITAASINAGALDGKGDWNIGKTGYTLSAAGVDAVWDEPQAGHVTAGTFGLFLDAAVTSRATPAQVNTEVLDVMNVDTITLPGQVAPPLAPTHRQAIGWLYKLLRNKKEQTASEFRLYDDAGTVVDAKAAVSDAAGIATKQELATGP